MSKKAMSQKAIVQTSKAPQAIGPYSQGVLQDGILYCSGQIPIDPHTGKLVDGSLQEQAHQMFKNLQAVAEAAGTTLDKTLKTTLYLKNMDNFSLINAIYGEYFSPPYPARSTIEVARLPMQAYMEIDAIIKVDSQ